MYGLTRLEIYYVLDSIELEYGFEVADEVEYGLYVGEVYPDELDMWDAAEECDYFLYLAYKRSLAKLYYPYYGSSHNLY